MRVYWQWLLAGRYRPLLWALMACLVLTGVTVLVGRRLPAWNRTRQLKEFREQTPGGPQLPGAIAQPRRPGLLSLDDFQVVVPPGWQRRKDWEDEGPGTKLFLLGPVVGKGQLVVGIDTYPLRGGTTLAAFAKQYSARWNQALLTDKPAVLCNQPARMLALSENGLDKVYLLTVWRDKGLALGMIAPAGQMAAATPTFRLVVDTFQLYE